MWLVVSGVFALIASIQLHTPGFLSDCPILTHGRVRVLQETAFVYGWLGTAGPALAVWILGRLSGSPLRGTSWLGVGAAFWNAGLALGLVGIAASYARGTVREDR